MISPAYRAQVDLLLRVLPHVAAEKCFALKGGTAINLFIRDMPRFSVDIDLTYLPFDGRAIALQNISQALNRIKAQLEKAIPGIVATISPQAGGDEAKLICSVGKAIVKIEVNTTLRGHLWPTREMQVTQATQDEFGKFAAITVVSNAELFGGKLCAALDRQHPRDLFDVHQLFANEGITDDIRLGFVASLLSHSRPIHEIVRPTALDQRTVFATQFAGMTLTPFEYDDFEVTRHRLMSEVRQFLVAQHRDFLLSFKAGEPAWDQFPIADLQRLPAVQWKLQNVQQLRMNQEKHAAQLQALADALTDE